MKKIGLIILVLLLSSCATKTTILLDDYLEVRVNGVTGFGEVFTILDPQLMDELDQKTDLSLYQINQLYESIKVQTSSSSLSNGDTVSLKLNYLENDEVQFKYGEKQLTAKDLPSEVNIDKEDILEGLSITVDGISGRGEIHFLKDYEDPILDSLIFEVLKANNLSNGEEVTFRIKKSETFEKSGYKLMIDDFTYKVDSLYNHVSTTELFTNEIIEQLDTIGLDLVNGSLRHEFVLQDYEHRGDTFSLYSEMIVNPSNTSFSIIEGPTLTALSVFHASGNQLDSTYDEKSALYLTYQAKMEIEGVLMENVQIGVALDALLERDGSLHPNTFNSDYYRLWDVQNRKGDIHRLEARKFEDMYKSVTLDILEIE